MLYSYLKQARLILFSNLNLNWFTGFRRQFDIIWWIISLVWILEWLLIIEYLMGEYWRTYIIFPIRLPIILILILFYWLYLWSMAVWRRTQFGRFTRGERKLWAKAYTSFWVAELVTFGSFILIYFWLSWGPLPLVNRYILFPRKGLYLEFIFFSYLIFLAYIIKLSTRWYFWRYNYFLVICLLLIFILLLWRDIMMLLTREIFTEGHGARWSNVKLTTLIYSLSPEWWVLHLIGNYNLHTFYFDLYTCFESAQRPFAKIVERNNFLNKHYLTCYSGNYNNYIDWTLSTSKLFIDPLLALQQSCGFFYPRRIGYAPKRIAMWQLLFILKMWHHLFILVWWLLFLFRLTSRRRTTYNFVAVCYFNIYCCYILGLLFYILYFAFFWELYLKLRPTNFNWHRLLLFIDRALIYICRGINYGCKDAQFNELFFTVIKRPVPHNKIVWEDLTYLAL